MKKKSNDMSLDMFTDATSSTPIPVFTTANEAGKDDTSIMFEKEPFPINWENRTVSARALHKFLGVAERFSKWCKRYFAHGLVENVDFRAIGFKMTTNNGAKIEIGDYSLSIDAAKSLVMMQRSEKGRQARDFFHHVEKKATDKNLVTDESPSWDKPVNTKYSKRVIQAHRLAKCGQFPKQP